MSSLEAIKHRKLRPIASAFVKNIGRTATAAAAPAMIAWGVRRDQLLSDVAVFNTTGKLEADLLQLDNTFNPGRKYKKEFKNLQKAFFSSLTPKQFEQFLDLYGVRYINFQLKHQDGMRLTMHALLASIVIESWTAFETLAAEVWYVALDHGPAEWRKRTALKSNKFKGGNSEPPASLDDVSKIPDPQKAYGSFLRETEKVSLQRLHAIKEWYKTTFGKQNGQKIFAADIYIDALSAVRNVITHKAGVADRKYVDLVQSFPELKTITQNRPLHLDGEIVSKLRTSAIVVGREALAFVDSQIAYRKKKS